MYSSVKDTGLGVDGSDERSPGLLRDRFIRSWIVTLTGKSIVCLLFRHWSTLSV